MHHRQTLKRPVESCLNDSGIDGVLVVYVPHPCVESKNIAFAVTSAAMTVPKVPLFVALLGDELVQGARQFFNKTDIPTFVTPEQAVRSFMFMYRYDYNLKLLQETPEAILKDFVPDAEKTRGIIETAIRENRRVLHLTEVKEILDAYGIPIVETVRTTCEDDCVDIAGKIGYPVVLKIDSETIIHKLEEDGVQLNLRDEKSVREACRSLHALARSIPSKLQRCKGIGMQILTERLVPSRVPATAARPRRLRVLQVALGYFPYAGGLETHVHEVSKRLAKSGVETTVLTVDTSRRLPRVEHIDGVQVRRVHGWPGNREFCLAPDLHREILNGSWDVIHCQGIHTLVPPLAMVSACRAKTPFVVTFHSGGHSSGVRKAVRGAQWRALRPLLLRAARLVAVSRFEAAYFQHHLALPADRFVTIRNGSQLPNLTIPAPESRGTLVVSVGRLERYKGHQRVIAALPFMLAQYPDVRLLILGSGPFESQLRQQAQDLGVADRVEIRMMAPGNREEMARTLGQASVMALLSEYEAHPIAVMEALALKCPVLVCDTSGFSELAGRPGEGYIAAK